MHRRLAIRAIFAAVLLLAACPAFAQKQGGTLRMYIWDNPPSASIQEEATVSTVTPFMSLYNNLVLYDQHERLNTPDNIRPELATSWAWNEDKTRLTFKLREGVSWHDGKPFTAKDVVCTLDKLRDRGEDKFRKNPRSIWYHNLKAVEANGDFEVSFQLNRPQSSFLYLFATGYNPVYPCHVSAADMRTKPIGTGPFKLVEFKSNKSVKVVRNADYWRKGHPYIDGIDWRVISNRSTRALAFVAGEFDMTFSLDLTVAAGQGHSVPAAEGDLRAAAHQQHHEPDRQPRPGALQRRQNPLRPGAGDRPQGLHRHPHRGQGQDRRRAAAGTRGAVGHAAGDRRGAARATVPTSRRAGRRPARSWRVWATARATRSRSKWQRATYRSIATRRCSSSTS